MFSRVSARTFAEFAAAMAIVAVVQVHACATQPRINVDGGKGFDGATYADMAQRLAAGERPEGQVRYVRRIGTPFLAGLVGAEDIVDSFLVVSMVAALISSALLLLWLRRFLETPWLRLALVALYATHWLQLVRFTIYYPANVDPWTQVACFAGLNAIAWYEQKPRLAPAAAVALISAAGVFFREAAILVPLAFLFARSPRIEHLRSLPWVRIRNFPRLEQWIPLGLACAALLWIESFIVPVDPTFSSAEFLERRAYNRNLIEYLLGWMVAFGPALFVVIADWRSAVDFFARHRVFLAYTAGLAGLAWVGSIVAERHTLYWGAPIVYVLLGRTIERHRAWFRSPALLAFLLATQAVVHRVFWTTPPYVGDYLERIPPPTLLTPVGDSVTYLHLFVGYIQDERVVDQFAEFVALAAIVFLWISRRAHLTTPLPQASAQQVRSVRL